MALLRIIVEPDPRYGQVGPALRQKAEPITEITDEIRQLAADMHETMIDAIGIGLAAPQIGVLQRIIVIHLPEDYDEGEPARTLTLINPEVVKAGGREAAYEGCLSFPDLIGEVERYGWVIMKAQDLDGNNVRFRARGSLARALQHEIDHLDGVLFFDRMDDLSDLFYVETEEPAEEESGSEANPVTA